tara:strand:+ start:160 stop:312 length:153 start_codon:yes stop_codon:yes gene_type:complete
MSKYQLIYNGHECFPLVNTREEAESFKEKSEKQSPDIIVEIKEITLHSSE